SVHPSEKDAARLVVRNALRAVDFGGCERMVRINQLPLGLDDLHEIIPESPDLILIPKVEAPNQVLEVSQRIEQLKGRHEIKRPIWLMPIVESAVGVENAYKIASSSGQIAALTIGLEDYTADLGVVKTLLGTESLCARQRLVNAALAAGVQGMGCVHPVQIPVIHQAFAPTQVEVDKALRIVAAYNEAQEKGLSVVSLGS